MKALAGRLNRRLLFRTYAVIVGGLVLFAAALDFGFNRLQEQEPVVPVEWIDGNLALIEARLSALPASEWGTEAAVLQAELGYPVKILPLDHFVQIGEPISGTQEIFDTQGRTAYFRRSAVLDAGIQIGPLPSDRPTDSVWVGLIPTFFYLSIVVIVSLWLWPLLRDVNILTHAARSFAADYSQPMVTRDKTTTLRELAATFDEMSARIRGLIQSQKEFTSALSHEVRTPLARIKFAMAVMGDKSSVAEELDSIEQDVQEIDRLIGTMLDYARLDRPEVEVSWQPIRVDAWLEEIVAKSRPRNGALRIETRAPTELVRMDAHLMELALSNLLVNACRYARETVTVRFTSTATEHHLAVADDGPGIPAADRETVFKPFTRLDDSRSRSTGGYGLGLAIVARIAARHEGSVRAERSELGGAKIVVAWPRHAQPNVNTTPSSVRSATSRKPSTTPSSG